MDSSFERFRREGEELIALGAVRDLEFSQGTYQVLINEEEEYWPFIQFDGEGHVKDAFCSCDIAEEDGFCPHLAAAYRKIYGTCARPLHERFLDSLWYCLSLNLCDRIGGERRVFSHHENAISAFDAEKRLLFSLRALSREGELFIDKAFVHKEKETEENSIKFSNLTSQELSLWHEGRPSLRLRYELSFWADLAKYLAILEDAGEPLEISLLYDSEDYPHYVFVRCRDFEIKYYVYRDDLEKTFSHLPTLAEGLKVFGFHTQALEKMVFHPENGEMELIWKEAYRKELQKDLEEGIEAKEVGKWLYIPKKAIYLKELSPLEGNGILAPSKVTELLDHHMESLERFLEKEHFHQEPNKVSYAIAFDDQWNLCIEQYLFQKGDLSSPYGVQMNHWGYIKNKGFFCLKEPLFQKSLMRIKEDEVGDFVYHYRSWLNSFPGFITHITNIDSQLSFNFDSKEGIRFFSRAEMPDDEGRFETHDFGDWIYIYGEGFYSKSKKRVGIVLRSGLEVKPKDISVFVKVNREELEFIDGFFMTESPFRKIGLSAFFQASGDLVIEPDVLLKRGVQKKHIHYFEDVVYCQDKGFYLFPKEQVLPPQYLKKVIIKPNALSWFLSSELDSLRSYFTKIDAKLQKPKSIDFVYKGAFLDKEKWVLQLAVQTDLGEIKLTEVWKGFKEHRRFLFTKAGLLDLNHEIFDWIETLSPAQVRLKKGEIALSTLDLFRFHAIKEPRNQILDPKEAFLLESFFNFSPPNPPDLSLLKSSLRPYQMQGVEWLWFLHSYHLSGLLCDDMGLGKTHQAMALIAALKKESPQKKILVVCPTSVIFHWEEKLKAFLPDLKVYTYYRDMRSLEDFLEEYDILLTSYGLLRFDQDKFFQISFDLVFFDEVQMAKNAHSQTFYVLSRLQAKMKIGLTGTPIENNLKELKTLFDLALPGYMPREETFKHYFVNPIEKEGDLERKELLKRYVKPFVLRRKKQDVLSDLPEKTEEKLFCSCTQEQIDLYRDVLEKQKRAYLSLLENPDSKVPYIHIFVLLTKLKQICNHPALYYRDVKNYRRYHSGKWDLFVDLINQAIESEQKIVVFTQYLGMLDIMALYLKERSIAYSLLKGDTRNRQEELTRFQTDPNNKVFLCSLKAGGLGIDLTAASVVIHYDRWWNAAREDQATDRVHRLGQKRGVQVLKFVTRQTLEERIDQIITEKSYLVERIIGASESSERLDRETLIELLQMVPYS